MSSCDYPKAHKLTKTGTCFMLSYMLGWLKTILNTSQDGRDSFFFDTSQRFSLMTRVD